MRAPGGDLKCLDQSW